MASTKLLALALACGAMALDTERQEGAICKYKKLSEVTAFAAKNACAALEW
jgi:hypothetical protein